jgi:hypothetical protein
MNVHFNWYGAENDKDDEGVWGTMKLGEGSHRTH